MFKSILRTLIPFILFGVFLFHGPATQVKGSGVQQEKSFPDGIKSSEVNPDYGRIPLYFISNEGQVNNHALFYAKTLNYTLWLTENELVFDSEWGGVTEEPCKRDISRLVFLDINKNPKVIPSDISECKANYFIGNDESKWRTNVPTSKAVVYKNLYPNIDLKVYGVEDQIEYDWIIKPGGEVSDIRLLLEGATESWIDEEQNLVVKTDFSKIKHKKPECYQYIEGKKVSIDGSFHKKEKNIYGIEVKKYNRDYELIIDPIVLVYSTFLGGRKYDDAHDIAVDSQGAAYITGRTRSPNFPTKNPIQGIFKSKNRNAFITKINPEGTGIVYSTFLGGSKDDYSHSLAIDSAGAVYVTGKANSLDFPLKNPFQANNKGSDDVFITKISPDGSELVFSSFLGGTGQEWGTGVAVDSEGAAYVTGATTSADFPTKKAFQNNYKGAKSSYPWDAFITKIHPKGTHLVYSSFLGGNEYDFAKKVAVNSKGEAYIIGNTASKDFPTKKPFQKSYSGSTDAFICKVHRKGIRLLYSTYLGGSEYDKGSGIALDSKGSAYVTGTTASPDFPLKNAWQNNLQGKDFDENADDAYVTKISPRGNKIIYSTLVDGSKWDEGKDIAVDSDGAAYVTGSTASKDFPTENSFQKKLQGYSDAFISKIHRNGKSLLYSTYLGGSEDDLGYGIAVDSQGKVYVAGWTSSKDFPRKKALQKKMRGGQENGDAFITKMELK